MRQKATPKKKVSKEQHLCSECALGEWVTDFKHLDHLGEPICIKCPYRKHYVLRITKACDKFQSKEH